jgi:hypothetical protein
MNNNVNPAERASAQMWEYLMEEQFFFKYHLRMSREEFRAYPILERKWMIDRFIKQREREDQHMKAARKKS